VIASNEIHIPVGQPLSVELRSADVIHDFWAPQLARKIDIVPGHPNYLRLEADHPGTYLGVCVEFCGTEHAWMRFQVIAQPPDRFAEWLRAQEATPVATSPEAIQGAQIFADRTCANCHRVAHTVASASIGPDLTHVAGQRMLAAGALENTSANIEAWLHNPDEFKPGSHMPNLHLSKKDLDALVAYLGTLK